MVGVWYQFIISIEDSSKRDLFQFDNKFFSRWIYDTRWSRIRFKTDAKTVRFIKIPLGGSHTLVNLKNIL